MAFKPPRLLRYGLLTALALGGVLLFLLASASSNTSSFERNYPLLLAINGAIAAVLFVLVVALVTRVWRRLRQRRFGARLMARFAVAFALMGVLPGALIYLVSVQFLSRSIESWFDVRVDRALESGLTLGRAALEAQLADLTIKARNMALELAEVSDSQQLSLLERARERSGVHEALLITVGGRLVGASSASGIRSGSLVPEMPSTQDLRQARVQRRIAAIEGDPLSTDPQLGLRTRVIVLIPAPISEMPSLKAGPSSAWGNNGTIGPRAQMRPSAEPAEAAPVPMHGEPRLLQLVQRVPPSVAVNAQALQNGYREYQELSLSRGGLQRMYAVTLTLTLLLAVFAAMASGVLLASSMTAPILTVAEGTRAVAEGDFRPVREFTGNDELKQLAQSFNAMVRQLREARGTVEAQQREVENAKAYLERVLTNLSAGVIVLDRQWRLVTANYGASRILNRAFTPHAGQPLAELVPVMAEQVMTAFADQALAATPKDSWQQQMQVPRAGSAAQAEPLALLARGSRLPLDNGMGYVVVFDDITQVISAQRAVAWGEVARRLAHEIKNPLTPIQLAAERLQMKLKSKLPVDQIDILVRGTSTIVNQVTAMKRMVDDFRDYARVPPARLHPLNLNALIEEVAALYGVGTGGGPVSIELALSTTLPAIEGDATQLRQVIHNLLSNAQEAILGQQAASSATGHPSAALNAASTAPGTAVAPKSATGTGHILIKTELVSLEEPGRPTAHAVRLAVEDSGPGFPTNILRRAFEPYVTTKPAGTGLGLAMVKKIVDEHGARIELVNRHLGSVGGAVVTIVFRRLVPESTDNNLAPQDSGSLCKT